MGLHTGPMVPQYSGTVLYWTFLANGQEGAGALEYQSTGAPELRSTGAPEHRSTGAPAHIAVVVGVV